MKNIVITGGTSGIGQVAATTLAQAGARIILIARNPQRAEVTLQKLRVANAIADHKAYFADLSSIAETKRVALQIAADEPIIDVLINNAGAVFMGDLMTAENLSPTFALNHLSYFIVTLLLLPNLRAASQARIICTASRAHRYATMNFNNLQRNGIAGYAQSKLENLLFVRMLSQRLEHEAVTVNAFHPGFVATRFADNTNLLWRSLMQARKWLFGLTPEQGTQTLLYLARSDQVSTVSGNYFVGCKSQLSSIAARSDESAQRLWNTSVKLTGVNFPTV